MHKYDLKITYFEIWGLIGVARIVGTCLVFISSEQSTAKTIFLDALLNLTMRFGRKITKRQEELFGNFTNIMEFNILLAIDDSKSRFREITTGN